MSEEIKYSDRMLSLGLARVTEAAALASAKLIGRGDEKAADQAAVDAMRVELNKLEIRIESSCSGGYRGSTTLMVYQKDLENLRKVNNIEKFQRGYKNTPLNFYKQIELAVKSLCF